MDFLIVFNSKEEMIDFENQGHTLPGGWWLDYMENGKLSIMPKEDGWDTGEWEHGYPNLICGGTVGLSQGFELFMAMPELWRKDYRRVRGDGDVWGYYIGRARQVLNSEIMEKIQSYYGDDEALFYIWTPPPTRPINSQEIVDISGKHPEPIIEGIWGAEETLLLSGKAAVGKSVAIVDIAYKLGNCKTLWGTFPIPRPVTSLIIQSEVSQYALKGRLDKFLKANPDFKNDRVFFLGCSFDSDIQTKGWLNDEKFQKQIVSVIEKIDADVLWIDPLISFNPVDENNNSKMRGVLDSFMDGIKKTGVSVGMAHHMGKTGGTRGASAIRDWAANALELEVDRRESGESRIKVIHDKARNFAEVDPFYLTRTKDLTFELAESKATRQEDERLKCVVDALKKAGGRIEGQGNFTQVISKMKNGVKNRTAVDRIKDARDCGLILELDGGAGKSKIYKFPEK